MSASFCPGPSPVKEAGQQARYRSFVKAARKVLKGEHGGSDHAKARELVHGIDSAPNNAPRLWRKEKASDVAGRLATSTLPALRTSQGQGRPGANAGHRLHLGQPQHLARRLHLGDRTRCPAIHAYPISWHPTEREWITAGRFRVLKVDQVSPAGGVRVLVKQTGVFYD
jgi:hypothetical protein